MNSRPSHTTALLLFIRNEKQEAQLKPLALGAGRRVNVQLLRTLNRHARRQAKRSGLPLIIVKGDQQVGATFGERLANAFEKAFSQGYERVLAIGNDCLHLNSRRLQEASRQLENTDMVLGPALDGGVYLLGIHRSAYRREAFIGLPWQTPHLFQELLNSLLPVSAAVALLDKEEDADDFETFRRLLAKLPAFHWLSHELRSLLSSGARPAKAFSVPASSLLNPQHPLRGPPRAPAG